MEEGKGGLGANRLSAGLTATDQPADMAVLTLSEKMCVCVWGGTVWLCALLYDRACTPAEHRCHTSSRQPGAGSLEPAGSSPTGVFNRKGKNN